MLFGTGEGKYPGMLATEEIGQNETMIEVPSHMIISSKKAYFSEIHHIIVENP